MVFFVVSLVCFLNQHLLMLETGSILKLSANGSDTNMVWLPKCLARAAESKCTRPYSVLGIINWRAYYVWLCN